MEETKAITESISKDTFSIWNGISDISWYNENVTEFHLKTAEQFAGLATLVNDGYLFKNNIIYLDVDINLSNHEWIPIGTKVKYQVIKNIKYPIEDTERFFSGTFDGQYHFIKNLTTNSSNYCHGLFGYVFNGTIKNVRLIDTSINNNKFIYNSNEYLGILIDHTKNSYILNSYTTGCIINDSPNVRYIGGIVGVCEYNTTIIGCYSTASIKSSSIYDQNKKKYTHAIGGITGRFEGENLVELIYDTQNYFISDCWFGGSISCENDSTFIGGIIGIAYDMEKSQMQIQNCLVTTIDINCTNYDKMAFIGNIENSKMINNCYCPIVEELKQYKQSDKEEDKIKYASVRILSNKPILDEPNIVTRIKKFKDKCFVNELNSKSYNDIKWVYGNTQPTFSFDDPNNIFSEYYAIMDLLDQAKSLIKIDYKDFIDMEYAIKVASSITKQSSVDEKSNAIQILEDAMQKLEYAEIDCSILDLVVNKIYNWDKNVYKTNPEKIKEPYKNFEIFENIYNSINIHDNMKQSELYEIAENLRIAISSLEFKDADYTEVDNIIKRANELDKDLYKDFTGVENAIDSVVRDKKIIEYMDVCTIARSIKNAIDALEYKNADYSEVDESIKVAKALNETNYENFYIVKNAINEVNRNKNITQQISVDKMAKNINDAILNLKYLCSKKNNITSEENKWSNVADICWYNEDNNEFHLKTEKELAGLATLVNNGNDFANKTIYLDSDMDLSGHEWVSIGGTIVNEAWYKSSYKRVFSGTFDGQHHFIRYLITDQSSYCHGLFGFVVNGKIKNTRVVDSYIHDNPSKSNNNIGIIADQISNSYILGSYTTGKIISISSSIEYVGGIVGLCEYISQIVGCYSTAKININNASNSICVGGIVGGWLYEEEDSTIYRYWNSIISNCWFNGSITCKGKPFAGGIIGRGHKPSVQIKNCFIPTVKIICNEFDNVAMIGTIEDKGNVFMCYVPSYKILKDCNLKYQVINKVEKKLFGMYTSKDKSFNPYGHIKAHINYQTIDIAYITEIDDFSDKEFINKLHDNIEPGVAWVSGINYPTFIYDDINNITATDQEIEAAKNISVDGFDNYYPIKIKVKYLSEREKKKKLKDSISFPYVTPWYVEK